MGSLREEDMRAQFRRLEQVQRTLEDNLWKSREEERQRIERVRRESVGVQMRRTSLERVLGDINHRLEADVGVSDLLLSRAQRLTEALTRSRAFLREAEQRLHEQYRRVRRLEVRVRACLQLIAEQEQRLRSLVRTGAEEEQQPSSSSLSSSSSPPAAQEE